MKTENWLFAEPLPLDKVFDLLDNPRDLTIEEFRKLKFFLSLDDVEIISRLFHQDGMDLAAMAIATGLVDSRGEFKRMQNGFRISEFFETGIDGLTFAVIRKGKKEHQLVFHYKHLIIAGLP